MTPHRVVALCLGRVVAFDLSIAAEVFSRAADGGRSRYEFEACAPVAGRVASTTGFRIDGVAGLGALERADTVVVPGYRPVAAPPPARALAALRSVVERGGRAISICTGAFALAHAGLLDGRRATTHWSSAGRLAEMFPAVTVVPDALYVDEGRVLTSAGLSAGIDLCLHVVRRDHGEAVGASVARAMVAPPHRDGGQAQFIDRPLSEGDGSLAEVRAWALEHLREPLDVATLAARAAVSPRTFARRFVAETGTSPLKWLHSQRVLEARRLLERTDVPIERVAAGAGFGSAPSLRQHFRRATATTPTAYRRAFRGAAASAQRSRS
ncbi:MAG: helix-turn-helix domain-containing protein [Solirubrobacterales bacterium]|nr:helix-turn-helix domain-containing protein [Solirubrobacterales bacterium]